MFTTHLQLLGVPRPSQLIQLPLSLHHDRPSLGVNNDATELLRLPGSHLEVLQGCAVEGQVAGCEIHPSTHHSCFEHICQDSSVSASWSDGAYDLGACEGGVVVLVGEAVVQVAVLEESRLG